MDPDSDPAVNARRRRALLVAILAFPVAVGLATLGTTLDILPGWVQLEEAPAPTVVPAERPRLDLPGGPVVQPPVVPGPPPAEVPTLEGPPPPVTGPPPGPTGSEGDAGLAAGGSPDIPGGTGSGPPAPGPAGSG
ncbi:MAG: hypothetical protein M3460_28245, partial [Actinomycetota bacterium]|nr:hypothetical protein [Actinomycetota bacterium]